MNKLGTISQNELDQKEWIGRKWDFGVIAFRFINSNGHFQLYYDFNESGEPIKINYK